MWYLQMTKYGNISSCTYFWANPVSHFRNAKAFKMAEY